MDRITRKLFKYFITTIGIVILISILLGSVFLSKFYINSQYEQLKDNAVELYNALSSGTYQNSMSMGHNSSGAMLIKDGEVTPLSGGMMGIMPFLRSVDYNDLKEKGKYTNPSGQEFLYYRHTTDIGYIVLLQSNKYSESYLSIVYIVLTAVFFMALLVSLPLISYFGKKFTVPIIKLQKASSEIAKGNYETDILVKSNDEIEELSRSLKYMADSIKKNNELQRDFIANVSHDFKTPLSIIRNYSEAITDGIVDGEETRRYSKEIILEVDRLNSLVMDILQLSKFQGGAVYDMKEEYFSIKELIESCSNKLQAAAQEKSIKIITSSVEAHIYGDYNYLYRVIYNFIDNAIKFSNEGGKIEIMTIRHSGGMKVIVKDYGIGIAKDELSDVWIKYHKHTKSGGLGLGLAICSEILKSHGFEYGVESSLGSGVEFYFIVPGEKCKF
jgi:signal transduction histidine kinase